jgi:ABC-type lipoprotein export system ATPase subunit
MSLLFELRNVRKSFQIDDKATGTTRLEVLKIDHLVIPAGRLIAIIGKTGVGKTTLLNLLGGLDRPEASDEANPPEIWLSPSPEFHSYLGERINLAAVPDRQTLTSLSRLPRCVSHVFQSSYLLEASSVRLNLAIAREAAGQDDDPSTLKRALIQAQFDSADVDKTLNQRVLTLSGGEKKRVGLARAFSRDPFIIFADEPTSDLDPETAKGVINALKEWQRAGKEQRSVLWVTHDYELAQLADAILPIRQGRTLEVIPIERLSTQPAIRNEAIKRLVYTDDLTNTIISLPPACSGSLTAEEDSKRFTSSGSDSADAGAKPRIFWGHLGLWNGARLAAFEMFVPPQEENKKQFRWLVARILNRYSQRASALVILTLGLLSLLSLNTALQVRSYFTQEINDPRLRHVVVEGDVLQNEFPISDKALDTLECQLTSARPSRSVEGVSECQLTSARPSRLDERASFGRLTSASVIISRVADDDTAVGRPVDAQILRINEEEPITGALQVKNDAGETATLRQVLAKMGYPSVIVSRRLLERLAERNEGKSETLQRLQLKQNGHSVIFGVAGITDSLPTDRIYVFDGIISHKHHVDWMEEVDPRSVPGNHIPSYERIAVYFTKYDYNDRISVLDSRNYIFDRANVDKLKRLISITLRLDSLFTSLLIAVAVMVVLVNATLVRIYLQNNEKQLAVLLAHGVSDVLAVANMLAQIVTNWLFGMLFLGIVAVLALVGMVGLQRFGFLGTDFAAETSQFLTSESFLLSVWLAPLLTLGLLVIATVGFYFRWKSRLPSLAQILRRS